MTHEAPHIDQYAKLELEAIIDVIERKPSVGLYMLRQFLDNVHVIPVHSKKQEKD